MDVNNPQLPDPRGQGKEFYRERFDVNNPQLPDPRGGGTEPVHNPLSGLMRGLAVLGIVVMLAGQVVTAWALWVSPDNEVAENLRFGLKLYGGGFLAAIGFAVLANFTLPSTRDRRTKPGTKIAAVASLLALAPIFLALLVLALLVVLQV